MNKKIPLGIVLAILIVVIAATYSVTMLVSMRSFNDLVAELPERTAMYSSLSDIDTIVRKQYSGEIDEQLLQDSIAKGYIDGLDDEYSQYMNGTELSAYNKYRQGIGTGIGAAIMSEPHPDTGNIYVSRVYSSGPAEAAGLLRDDQITAINGVEVSTMEFTDAVEMLRGASGTTLSLTVLRGAETKELAIVCSDYNVQTVFYEAIGEIGYIKITGFRENTPAQFDSAIEALKELEIKFLIYDLRGTNDESFDYAALVIDRIVPTGTIAYAEYNNGTKEALFTSDAEDITFPSQVLVNNTTTGPAELFACDLRDFGKATIVGTTTAGQGLYQNAFTLNDGGAIKLTVAEYLPYKSENFNGIGVEPDHVVEVPDDDVKYIDMLPLGQDKQFLAACRILTDMSENS